MSLKDPASGYTTVVSVIDDLSVALTEIRPFRNFDSPSPRLVPLAVVLSTSPPAESEADK